MALDPVVGDDDNLAILNLAHKARADDVKRAGFRREDGRVPQFSENEWPDAQWIAYADEPFSRQHAERIGALDLLAARRKSGLPNHPCARGFSR